MENGLVKVAPNKIVCTDRRTDSHGDSSIPPPLRCGGITNSQCENLYTNITTATSAVHKLMGTGLHGENGLDPETAVSLLQTSVFPIPFYGSEVIVPNENALNILETQYKKLHKQILSLPTKMTDYAIYMLSGLLPVRAILHKRMLSLLEI